ncbi:MAG: UDP-N-acetylglucosamine--N-acetylmuramyl-(pentapeptide) pyrophosphoryl-undecaprenol N-acetylglucosamine transferase, partial [Candidatus Fimimonas sp.]
MKIVFCGGGTAGHITPNIALIEKLKTEECYYVGSGGMEKQMTQKLLQQGKLKKFYEISASKLQRKFTLKNFALPFLLLKSVSQAKKHLREIAPDVVFSKGGYVGLPVVIAARMLG